MRQKAVGLLGCKVRKDREVLKQYDGDNIYDDSSESSCAKWIRARDRSLKHQWSSIGECPRTRTEHSTRPATTQVNAYVADKSQQDLTATIARHRPPPSRLSWRLIIFVVEPLFIARRQSSHQRIDSGPTRACTARGYLFGVR